MTILRKMAMGTTDKLYHNKKNAKNADINWNNVCRTKRWGHHNLCISCSIDIKRLKQNIMNENHT